jgi:thiol-disulfide isomerase/thioredoxin
MWQRILAVVAVAATWAAASASAQDLGVGDPAPKLEVKEFVKGEPVTRLEKGKTYVVEFWATWCGPCRTSIPHLTELQKKHKDITVIGVSVWEQDAKAVKPFVDEMGDKMGYRVALDDVPENGKGNDGKMAKNWMQAAGQNGIPAAFIINGDGKVAWIGHPMAMDEPLGKIVAGTWDLQAAAAEHKQVQAQRRKLLDLRAKLIKAQQSGDPKEVLAVIDQAVEDDPKLEAQLGFQKFQLLASSGDADKAREYGQRLLENLYKDNAQALNNLAWIIVDPKAATKPDAKLVKLALTAALRADELTKSKDAAIADTLAKAYFDSGDAVKALQAQERAMKLAEGTPLEKDQGMKERLEEYRKAVQK